MTDYGDPDLETITPPAPPPYPAPSPAPLPEVQLERTRRGAFFGLVTALVIVSLVVGFGTATLVLNSRDSSPKGSVLDGLIVRQSDVPAGYKVFLLDHGADLTVGTLDLCNGRFPSEAQRVARRQVSLTDTQGFLQLSTEAVLYRTLAKGVEAFGELRSVAAHCPATPVKSPVGEPTVTTVFRPPPDSSWPRTPSVDRLAYDFLTTDAKTGAISHSMAIYLRRGRALIGLYFAQPDDIQAPVEGRTTIAGIVALFEARLANVPGKLVGA